MSQTFRIKVTLEHLIEVEIDEELKNHLQKRNESPKQYAMDVAQERLGDLLRGGDAFCLYEKAKFFHEGESDAV